MCPGESAFDSLRSQRDSGMVFFPRVFRLSAVNYFHLMLHVEYPLLLSVGNWHYIVSTVRAILYLDTAI